MHPKSLRSARSWSRFVRRGGASIGIGIASGVCAVVAAAGSASAVDVLVFTSGSLTHDNAIVAALRSNGHTATIGPAYYDFDGTFSLSGYDVVYLVPNYNWSFGDMPVAGQAALLNWIAAGGGLVTAEWTTWKAGALVEFVQLEAAFPVEPDFNYGFQVSMTYTQVMPDPIMNDGLPAVFASPLMDVGGGTNTMLVARPGATVFYTGDAFAGQPVVVGGEHGSGRVVIFSTTNGETQLADGFFSKLFSNAMNWAAQSGECYPDCDTSTGPGVLDIFDFLCFGNRFAAGDPFACDCDQTTGPNVCDIFDFLCFGNAFNAGCP